MSADTVLGSALLLPAFDTVDHSILLRRLETSVGISGTTALRWSTSCLDERTQSVKAGNVISTPRPLLYGVPQGSVSPPGLVRGQGHILQDLGYNSLTSGIAGLVVSVLPELGETMP